MNDENQSDKLKEIIEKYTQALPDKIKLIESLAKAFQKESNDKSFDELYVAVHKLAGSAGMYGFNEISLISKDFQIYLSDCKQKEHLSEDEWKHIFEFISKLKKQIS